MLKGALGALAGIMISGCALSPYAMEGVNDLPEDQTATLTIDTPFLDPYIFITMIDGVHPRSFSNTYKLLPGMRQITMSGNAQGDLSRVQLDILLLYVLPNREEYAV